MSLAADVPAEAFASPASTHLSELVQLRREAVALQRRMRRSTSGQSGGSVSARLGRGLDFAEVRAYQPGDDVRMIDWNVTARTGQAHTKLFVEERERPVLLFVDCRAGMRFGTRGMFKSALAIRLAALLGWCAVEGHDRVGGFVFTDDWHAEIRPQSGRRGLMRLFRAIMHAQQRVPVPGGSQFVASLSRLRHAAPAGSTVVLLSDFQGFDEAARTSLGVVLHSLDLLAVHIVDPLDRQLPAPGSYPLAAAHQRDALPQRLIVRSRADQHRYARRHAEFVESVSAFFSRGRHLHLQAGTERALLESAAAVLTRQPMP